MAGFHWLVPFQLLQLTAREDDDVLKAVVVADEKILTVLGSGVVVRNVPVILGASRQRLHTPLGMQR